MVCRFISSYMSETTKQMIDLEQRRFPGFYHYFSIMSFINTNNTWWNNKTTTSVRVFLKDLTEVSKLS